MMERLTWDDVVVDGVTYHVVQLELRDGQFTMDPEPRGTGRKWFGAGSWLILGPGDTYARAMTNDEFQAWRGTPERRR
jgi:hypothetical protein